MPSVSDRFKTVVYRGRIVRFRIPEHWIEEYEHEGGGTFYEGGGIRASHSLRVWNPSPGEFVNFSTVAQFFAVHDPTRAYLPTRSSDRQSHLLAQTLVERSFGHKTP